MRVASIILVVVVIVVVQLLLPESVTLGPLWLVPLVELSGIPIILMMRGRDGEDDSRTRSVMHV